MTYEAMIHGALLSNSDSLTILRQSLDMRLLNFLLDLIRLDGNLNTILSTQSKLRLLISLINTNRKRIKLKLKTMRLMDKKHMTRQITDKPTRTSRIPIAETSNIKRNIQDLSISTRLSTSNLNRLLSNNYLNLNENKIKRHHMHGNHSLTTLLMMTITILLMTNILGNLNNINNKRLQLDKRIILMTILRLERGRKTQNLLNPFSALRISLLRLTTISTLSRNLTSLRQSILNISNRHMRAKIMKAARMDILRNLHTHRKLNIKDTSNIGLAILRNIRNDKQLRLLRRSLIRRQLITPPLQIQNRNRFKIKTLKSSRQTNTPLIKIEIIQPALKRNITILNIITNRNFEQMRRIRRKLMKMRILLRHRSNLLINITLNSTLSLIMADNRNQNRLITLTTLSLPNKLRILPNSQNTIIPKNLIISHRSGNLETIKNLLSLNRMINIQLSILRKAVHQMLPSTQRMRTPRTTRMRNITISIGNIPIQTSLNSQRNRNTALLRLTTILQIIMNLTQVQRQRQANMINKGAFLQFKDKLNTIITNTTIITITTDAGHRGHNYDNNRNNSLAHNEYGARALRSSPRRRRLHIPFSPSGCLTAEAIVVRRILLALTSLFAFQ